MTICNVIPPPGSPSTFAEATVDKALAVRKTACIYVGDNYLFSEDA